MSKLFELTTAFYDAAWDFSTRLCLLPDQLTMGCDHEINPDAIIKKYRSEISAFLDLNGTQIPKRCHATYDQLDATIRNEVLPAFEVLKENWDELSVDPAKLTEADKLDFAAKCVYIINIIEMYVIPQASEFREEIGMHPA